MILFRHIAVMAAYVLSSCGGGGGSGVQAPAQSSSPAPSPGQGCVSQTASSSTTAAAGQAPQAAAGLSVPSGFTIEIIAHVPGARELAFAPNGDLFAGTTGSSVYVVAGAEGQAPAAHVFTNAGDAPAAGVALSLQSCALYVGAQDGVYRIPYTIGDQTARSPAVRIAGVRGGGLTGHNTTTVAVSGTTLYASVGSSCNACVESDPTRATIQQMHLDGSAMSAKAVRIRNAIALAVNPATGTLWAGDAGQDDLPEGHPYEFFDAVTLHSGIADYGWPDCEENRVSYSSGANCANTVAPLVEFPAYGTIIGAAFYSAGSGATYAFPQRYRGGAFVAMHGSWHTSGGTPTAVPRVAFVSMSGDVPQTPVSWSLPTVQWTDFISGFQRPDGSRIGRPTGVAVGPQGDLFVADDQAGVIYRIRP
jgi:glucose/arabinose dehydrogenase